MYIRLFNGCAALSDKKIPLGYFPWEMRISLQKSKIPHDHFILCPLYKHINSPHISDIQPGITGHVELKESDYQAFIRESGEELGLTPNIPLEPIYTSKKFTIYSVHIKHCSPVHESQTDKHSDYKPITLSKIGGFIHGDFESMLAYISSKTIYRYNNSDKDIIGLAILLRTDLEKTLHIN
jgi:hypothetical protein